jgi:hypothetical protein
MELLIKLGSLASRRERRMNEFRDEMKEKNLRECKLRLLRYLRERLEIINGRIEILEDELGELEWKPRVYKKRPRSVYDDNLVRELCAMTKEARTRKIKEVAVSRGIAVRSVYRRLQKNPMWYLRHRLNPVDSWVA